ncbi:MAG: hypothetical protein RLZZ299_1738 [Pseudomonadota bacterium]
MTGILLLTTALAAPAFEGEIRTYELDEPGGAGGAPQGMVFVLPPDADAAVQAGDLGDGARGARLAVRRHSDALLCTTAVPMGGVAMVKARLRVPAVEAGARPWTGMNVEVRARDDSGTLVSAPDAPYALLRNVRSPGDWTDVTQRLFLPSGTTQGELCFRFVLATGVVEIDRIQIVAPKPVTPAGPAPAPTAPPAPAVLTTPAETSPPAGAVDVADVAAPIMPATPSADADRRGRQLAVSAPEAWSGAACSAWFPSRRNLRIEGDISLTALTASAPDWSGIVIEAYHQDAGGMALPAGAPPFVPVFAATAAAMDPHFVVRHRAPPRAARSRLCARYASAAGSVTIHWAQP